MRILRSCLRYALPEKFSDQGRETGTLKGMGAMACDVLLTPFPLVGLGFK